MLRGQLRAQPRQRTQSHQHLHHAAAVRPAASAPNAISSMVEASHRLGQRRRVGRHRQPERAGLGLFRLERARQRGEPMPLGTGDVVGAIDRPVKASAGLPQRPRTRGPGHHRAPLVVQAVDLPIQARQGLPQPGIAQRRHAQRAIGRDVDRRGQLVQVQDQFGAQLLGHVLAEQIAQAPAGQRHGGEDPGQRARQQAPAQRAGRARSAHSVLASR